MPDESCRHCGQALIDFTQCSQCKKTISMICQNCFLPTPEQFHSMCFYSIDEVQTKIVPRNQIGDYLQMVTII